MKIIHLINRFSAGGASTVIRNIIQRDDENIHIICCMENVIEIDSTEMDNRIIEINEKVKFDPLAIYRFYRILNQGRFDVAHLHLPYAQTIGRVISKLSNVSYIVSTQHNVPENYHPVTRYLETVSRRFDSVTVSVSEDVQKASTASSLAWFSNNHTKWRTIYNGIDVMDFNRNIKRQNTYSLKEQTINEHSLVFLNVSHYIEQKAQIDLIKAMDRLVEHVPNAKLFLVGRGPLEQQLRSEVQNRDLEDHITVTGYVSQEDLYRHYAIADAFVLSSVSEGFGLVLVEAMAAKLPVIATKVLGAREVVKHESTGILVPPNDPNSLMEGMYSLRDSELRYRYGKNGYNRAKENYTAEKSAKEYVQLYNELPEKA